MSALCAYSPVGRHWIAQGEYGKDGTMARPAMSSVPCLPRLTLLVESASAGRDACSAGQWPACRSYGGTRASTAAREGWRAKAAFNSQGRRRAEVTVRYGRVYDAYA